MDSTGDIAENLSKIYIAITKFTCNIYYFKRQIYLQRPILIK